jgi:hypothetical protein
MGKLLRVVSIRRRMAGRNANGMSVGYSWRNDRTRSDNNNQSNERSLLTTSSAKGKAMPFRWTRVLLLLVVLYAGACANLKARKVPLAERLCGQDRKHDGFRYYLPRPYVVVAQRIPIAQHYCLGQLKKAASTGTQPEAAPQPKPVIEGLHPDPVTGERPLFDLQGRPLVVAAPGRPGWRVVADYREAPLVPVALQGDKDHELIVKLLKQSSGQQDLIYTQIKEAREEVKKDHEKLQETLKQLAAAGTVTPLTAKVMMESGGSPPPPPTPDNFQLIMLPDFEEQMAIKDCNLLAYGKYQLNFKDGWQLAGVGGSWDSTEVPVRILQSISNAISAAAAIEKKALTTLPITPEELRQFGLQAGRGVRDADESPYVLITTTEYIPPGVYRLNKPKEAGRAGGCGLLSELGIPTQTDPKVQLVKEETTAPPSKPSADSKDQPAKDEKKPEEKKPDEKK